MKENDKIENVNNEDGVSIYTLFSKIYSHILYLKSKWKMIAVFLVIGIVLGVWFAHNRKPKYLAQITFTIEETGGPSASSIMGLASQLGLSMGSDKQTIFQGYNIISFFQSRLMVQKTLMSTAHFEKGDELLVNRYIEFNHYREGWKKNPKLKNLTFEANKPLTRLQDSVLYGFYNDIVKSQLNVDKIDRRLTILSLTYVCTDELFSKAFAEELTKNVTKFYAGTRVAKTLQNIDVLQRRTDSVKKRLTSSLVGVASSTDAIPNANPLKSVLAVSTQSKTINAEIDRAAYVQLASSLQSARISLNQQMPLIDYIDTPILPLPVQKITAIKAGGIGGFLGVILAIIILTFRRKTF